MYFEFIYNKYFFLSFLPISLLSVFFWFLYFERSRKTKDPISIFLIAFLSGILSGLIIIIINKFLSINSFLLLFLEEFLKIMMAIVFLEFFKKRFKTLAGGVVFGFAVGLGFAFFENIIYLQKAYELYEFDPEFWLVFQGRFWSSTTLHATTTAVFGLFYSAAYLLQKLKTVKKSPLFFIFRLYSLRDLLQIFSLHIFRRHLVFFQLPSKKGHDCNAILAEGLFLSILIHFLFNFFIVTDFFIISFLITIGTAIFLKSRIRLIE